jgi:hypothetical protein
MIYFFNLCNLHLILNADQLKWFRIAFNMQLKCGVTRCISAALWQWKRVLAQLLLTCHLTNHSAIFLLSSAGRFSCNLLFMQKLLASNSEFFAFVNFKNDLWANNSKLSIRFSCRQVTSPSQIIKYSNRQVITWLKQIRPIQLKPTIKGAAARNYCTLDKAKLIGDFSLWLNSLVRQNAYTAAVQTVVWIRRLTAAVVVDATC